MTTPPRGNDPRSADQEAELVYDEYGRPVGRRPATTGEMDDHPPMRPPHLRGLSPELAERNRGRQRKREAKRQEPQGNGWFRNPFAKPKPEPEQPSNPWVTAADEVQQPRTSLGAAAPGADPAAPESRQPPARREQRKQGAKADDAQGNGWFQNPFARPKPAAGGGGGGSRPGAGVGTAQIWAGPRRGILVRRILGVLAVVLLLVLTININRKVSRSTVESMIDSKVRSNKTTFPSGEAEMWAAPLVKAFATYSEKDPEERKLALEPYAVNGLDEQLGWNGSGTQSAIDMVMSSDVQVIARDRAVVNATVQIQDGSWRCISVPVFTRAQGDARAFGLLANPVYRSCAGLTTPPGTSNQDKDNDSALADRLQHQILPPYLQAWARSDQQSLSRYLLPGTRSFGLGGSFTGSGDSGRPQVTDVFVPVAGPGEDPDRRIATFTVTFQGIDGKSTQTSTYQVRVQRQGTEWYIAGEPSAAAGADGVGGGSSLPSAAPTQGSGGMFSKSPAPYPTHRSGNDSRSSGRPKAGPTPHASRKS